MLEIGKLNWILLFLLQTKFTYIMLAETKKKKSRKGKEKKTKSNSKTKILMKFFLAQKNITIRIPFLQLLLHPNKFPLNPNSNFYAVTTRFQVEYHPDCIHFSLIYIFFFSFSFMFDFWTLILLFLYFIVIFILLGFFYYIIWGFWIGY